MRVFASIALWAYVPFVLGLFAYMRNRRHAVVAAFVIGWEFLPMDEIKLPLLVLSKVTACSVGVLMGMFVFDLQRVLAFRPKWYDIPMLVWCICPFFTSLYNDLGAYDGASWTATQTFNWGIPYFIGRVYFNDWEGMRDLCYGVFLGALVYMPLCLFESKMSPQLHNIVYGHFQHDFSQTYRFGGWRPMVFMQSGVALGMWMGISCLIGVWFWVTGAGGKQLWGLPFGAWVVMLLVVTVFCRSLSGVLFMLMGLSMLFWIKWTRNALLLYFFILAAPFYMYIRASGAWDGQNLIEAATASFGEDRAESLEVRIKAENKLTRHALTDDPPSADTPVDPNLPLHSAWFGWGRFSNYVIYAPWRVGHLKTTYDADRKPVLSFKDDAPTDGMWVITLGELGLIGLIAATVTILLPPVLARKRIPLAAWSHPLAAPMTAMAVILVLHMLDNLLNAMLSPIFVLGIGGISGLRVKSADPSLYAAPRPTGTGFPVMAAGFPTVTGLRMTPTAQREGRR